VAQVSVTPAAIAKARAVRQRLSAPAATSPADLVAWLGAVQSQDYPIARWSIAQRLAKRRASDVDAAIADGSIVRAHVLRPTWHFVARDDLRWMQALTAPRILARLAQYDRASGVDAAIVARSTKTIATAIERRGHLMRREIAGALSDAGITTTPWLVGHLVMYAELHAVVCSGVPKGQQQTYALVDERAPRLRPMARDEAIVELTRRYFRSHGPATAKDYQWWSGLSAADAARGIEMLGRALERVSSGGRTYFMTGAGRLARPKSGTAQAVQPFDEIVVAYTESRDVADVSGVARADGGLLARAIVLDGQIVARWRIESTRGSRAIAVEPLRRLSSAERDAAAAAASRFERFYLA
jgi:DNA glycosylase AlkZ-like